MEILFIVAAVVVLGFFVYIVLQGKKSKKGEQEIVKAKPVAVVPQEPEPINEKPVEKPIIESSPEEAVEELEKELEEREENITETKEETSLEKDYVEKIEEVEEEE